MLNFFSSLFVSLLYVGIDHPYFTEIYLFKSLKLTET